MIASYMGLSSMPITFQGKFFTVVSHARPTDPTPLRRHTLRLLALVARGAVAPLVPRLVSDGLLH
jgi:hypothetical protein